MIIRKFFLPGMLNIQAILLSLVFSFAGVIHAEEIPEDFDHDNTDFLLSGAHVKVECKICHVREVYKGIPQTCEECHSTASLIAQTKKAGDHFESVDACDNCHTVDSWSGARIDHESVIGTCIDCHNNIVTAGKSSDHVQSADECHDCHTTRRWKQSGFDHEIITGNCFSCHNGTTAIGKHEKHRMSNNQCDDCHHVKNWKSKTFDHKEISSACLICHQDVLPELPHPQDDKCQKCHNPKKKWQQVRFKHEKTNELCIKCHKDRKPVNHFLINTDANNRCDDCHQATSSWITNLRFTHDIPDYHEHRANTICKVCHLANSSTVLWRYGAYKPDCAGCHASNYNTSSHVKVQGTQIRYTVGDLAHCSGACHLYTDTSLTQKVNQNNRRPNYHTPLRGNGIGAP
ncbi:MAG: cytochrome c3 family protein [Gammaproteobacteria bacterium]